MSDDKITLDELFPLQENLDKEIASIHHIDYPSTHNRRCLALLVELGEFANETRCFKYWSNKGPSPKEIILDEYADALHFFLSLGVELGVSRYTHRFNVKIKDCSDAVLNVYELVCKLVNNFDADSYCKAFAAFLDIIPLFDYSSLDVINAYKKKLDTNHQRQHNSY
ncbi:MAG: dUTP diphosphatase [Candidatus Enteromonas sp.]|nr:dUTP diphosphatase [Mollicutes bacterium]MDY4936491.1 dUTP diphosphatase [Candidatus Enteromonas sp.]